MWHNKQEHNENRAKCYKEANGNCKFGSDSCWFMHKKHSALIGRKKKFLNAEHVNKFSILNLI